MLEPLSDRGVETGAYESLSDLTPYAVEFRHDEAGDDADRLDMTALRGTAQSLVAEVHRMVDAGGNS